MRRFLATALGAALVVSMTGLVGCSQSQKSAYQPIAGLDEKEEVTLKIAIPFETDRALDLVADRFMQVHPNVNVQLEYVDNYDENAMELVKSGSADIVFARDTKYAEEESKDGEATRFASTDDYLYNFAADEDIDFSNTTQKLMGNYTHTRTNAAGQDVTYQYSVPVGGEVRGLFVNKTLLASLGLEVPTSWDEFLDCCEALKSAGYVPIQGNPASAGTALTLATAVNDVAHDEASLEKMRNAEEGSSALFEDALEKTYVLATERYYDYKYVETEYNQFMTASDIGQARSFLGLVRDDATYEYEPPANNYGTVAFFPYLSYLGIHLDKLIGDYGLDTEYEFIVTPTAEKDASPTYLTPYYGICANKNSANLDWAREFTNFFFQTDVNKLYAENSDIVPNTVDAVEYMASKYGVNAETDCATCGDIYFSDSYNGYAPLSSVIISTVKASASKYMVVLNRDENGQIQYLTDEAGKEYLLTDNGDESTKVYREYVGAEDPAHPGYAFCTLDYYLNKLEGEFAKYRSN